MLRSSSGIQVLPAIQRQVMQVTTFVREPAYVSPVRGLEGHVFTEEEKTAFANEPGRLLEYRRGVENGLNDQFDIFIKDTTVSALRTPDW
jgi:cation diffusion facilitator CzcD-associated flavoprotein CzcO